MFFNPSLIVGGEINDVQIARYASIHIYNLFLKNGVRIYEFNDDVLHSKLAIIDSVYTQVGSYNLDIVSGYKNLELNVSIFDPKIALELDKIFEKDLKNSTEITLEMLEKRTIFEKFFHWICYVLTRVYSWV